MKNSDPRTIFTKSMLKSACTELIEKKELSKITVNELCGIAGVNRSTFYRYYPDIYALWAELEEDCFTDLINRIDLPGARNPQVFVNDMFTAIKKNSILTPTALQNADSNLLIPKIMEHYKKIAIMIWQTRQPDLTDRQLNYRFSILLGALTSIVQEWIQNGMEDSSDSIAIMMSELGFWGLFEA